MQVTSSADTAAQGSVSAPSPFPWVHTVSSLTAPPLPPHQTPKTHYALPMKGHSECDSCFLFLGTAWKWEKWMAKRLAAQSAFWLVTWTVPPFLLTFAVLHRNANFCLILNMCPFPECFLPKCTNVFKRKIVSLRLAEAQKSNPQLGPLQNAPAVRWAGGRGQTSVASQRN